MRSQKLLSDPPDDAFLFLNAAGLMIGATAGATRLLGVNLRDLVGRTPSDLPGHAATPTGDAEHSRVTFQRQDGELVEAFPVTPESGSEMNAVGAIWILRPVQGRSASSAMPTACDTAARSFRENGLDGTFQLSVDGQFTDVSENFAELCGYKTPAAFLAALSAGARHLYVDPARRDELMRRAQEIGGVTRFESAIYRADGTTTWISETLHAVVDREGRVQHYRGSVQDIGWRKLAEDIQNQAEEKWRAVVESSGECIVIADRAGMVYFANSRAQQSGVGLPGANVFAGFSGSAQLDLRAAIELAFHSMGAEVLSLEHSAPGAASTWYEIRVVPIRNGESVARVILIATDLTGKKRAEEAVREGQRMIGRVADASPAILYVYDFASERYVYVNHQVEKILGYTAETFLAGGKALAEGLVHKDDARLLIERKRLLTEARDDAMVFEYTSRMRHSSGRWLWIRARDVVFTRDAEGHPAQVIGMAEDVTERRRAAEERERSREQLRALSGRLQEAREEERAAISRRVHDELGQALTALSWELSKHIDQTEPAIRNQPEVCERLGVMKGMIDGMMQVVRKVSAELRPPILDHFGLVAAIEWQAKEFQDRYRITCEVTGRSRRVPDRDVSTAVFRIFQEILTNVARHSGATRVRVQFLEIPHALALVVHDNGRGITEGEKSQSLGVLGMSERAHLFGGRVEIQGTEGKGTTVTVHIPDIAGRFENAPRKERLTPPH